MHRSTISWTAVLASALVGCASAPPAPQQAPPPAERVESSTPPEVAQEYARAWVQTTRLIRARNFGEAYPRLSDLMSSSMFEQLPSEERHTWVSAAAALAREGEDFKHAQPLFVIASELPEAGFPDWDGRYDAAVRLQDSEDAVRSITTIARRWPESLGGYDNVHIRRLALGAGDAKAGDDSRMQLLEALYTANWKIDYGVEPSALWSELVRLLMEQGNLQRATEVSRRITEPRGILALRVDNRFDALVRADPARFEMSAAIDRNLTEWQALAQRYPAKLAATCELADRYLDFGRSEESLSLMNEVIERVAQGKPSASVYEDLNEKRNWIYDTRARALMQLGRWSEAERESRQAAALLEEGHPNVSNAINLAFFYVGFGRSSEALKALGPRLVKGSDVSSYGAMQVRFVLHAAALARKDARAARESLDYMREHQSDAVKTYEESLLVAGNLNEAAGLLTRRLKDPALRAEALADVQEYREPALSPLDRKIREGWRSLRERSDVRAAVAEVGRIEQFPLPPP